MSRGFRKGLTLATIAYFIFLMVLLFLIGWWGERNWLLSVLLFVPAIIWFVPFILLTPFHLVFRPKLCWITVAALPVICFVYLDFCWAFPDQGKPGLTLLTNNVGGRKLQTLNPFLKSEDPDIIALQEGWRAADVLRKQYPERFVSTQGEYVLASKIPIRKAGLLSQLAFRGRPIGARYELEYKGRSIVIYNIHMPTPRLEFDKLRGRGLVRELFGGKGVYSSKAQKDYREFVEMKIRLARELADLLQQERHPFLIAGDFNMPANGHIWELFHAKFIDAFGAKGRGYGFTFPGASGGLLKLIGTWLRLDYLFAGKDWQPILCRVEPRQAAEHCAVVARFQFKPRVHKP
ncbi:MAG: endonuclease/exonuclease/phosphatase family protein [Verrucomicrobiota bacterium]